MPSFHEWFLAAAPGSSFTYYVGDLAVARGDAEAVPRRAERTFALDDADAAWAASVNGLVTLVQRAELPLCPNGTHPAFHYIAQRTSK